MPKLVFSPHQSLFSLFALVSLLPVGNSLVLHNTLPRKWQIRRHGRDSNCWRSCCLFRLGGNHAKTKSIARLTWQTGADCLNEQARLVPIRSRTGANWRLICHPIQRQSIAMRVIGGHQACSTEFVQISLAAAHWSVDGREKSSSVESLNVIRASFHIVN